MKNNRKVESKKVNGKIKSFILNFRILLLVCVSVCVSVSAVQTSSQTTVFSYQGKLDASGAPANGNYDFEFKLFDAASGGTQQGATAQRLNVGVVNGVYAVSLDFGAGGLTGADRYLDIAVRTAGGGAFTQLAPRQQVMSTPYAVRSLNAGTASALSCAGCVSASQIGSVNGSAVTGTIPAASVPAGSGNYIQNTTSQQAASNFNISGNGVIGGSFGIGTATPQSRLHLAGNSGSFAIAFTNSANTVGRRGYRLAFDNDRFTFQKADDNGNFADNQVAIDQATGNVGIGTTTPTAKLHVSGAGGVRANVNSDSNAGVGLTLNNAPKWSIATVSPGQFQIFNDAIGQNAVWIDPATNNVGIGTTAPGAKLEVLGDSAGLFVAKNNLPGGTVAGFGSTGEFLIANNTNAGGRLRITENGNLRINNPTPNPLQIIGTNEMLSVNGFIRAYMPPLGIGVPVCQDLVTSTLVLCAVSSRRYKQSIENFNEGLSLISRLRPVSFTWKANGQKDFGLVAEDVADIAPHLAYYNAKGEVEGVKYDRIGVVAINAIKEQQAQIEAQQKQITEQSETIKKQQAQLDALTKLVCAANKTAEICKEK